MSTLDREDRVFILNLGNGENRMNPDSIGRWNSLLDDVENEPGPRALVITADGKFWSNGLDLEWFSAHVTEVNGFLIDVHRLFARLLTLGVPSIAAIQGHCFAAGAMLALACDERVMRADRGFFCLPEINIKIPFTPGMSALIQARLSPRIAHLAMTTGHRFGGLDAAGAEIVESAVAESELMPTAITRAAELAETDPETLATIKERMYGAVLRQLHDKRVNTVPVPGNEGV